MPTGKIKFFNADKGFGFIIPDDRSTEIFFHANDLVEGTAPDDLGPGVPVTYEVGAGRKGPAAKRVAAGSPAQGRTSPTSAQPTRSHPRSNTGRPQEAPRRTRSHDASQRGGRAGGRDRAEASIPLPQSTVALLRSVPDSENHPGLLLDRFGKFERFGEDEYPPHLCRVVKASAGLALQSEWAPRREKILQALGARTFRMRTLWRLTLHLARSSVLENAGLALHPVYGFAYLPGSGIKGLASAYAETVWLPAQEDRGRAEQLIARIMGWAPGAEGAREKGHPRNERAFAGSAVFHDAWPTTWPTLEVDIANSHHSSYYSGGPKREPPADWQSPNPVYFLAVAAGTEFDFAISHRDKEIGDPEDLSLAGTWLKEGLTTLGAGAKTAAGYGFFEPDTPLPELPRLDGTSWTAHRAPVRNANRPSGGHRLTAGQRTSVELCEQRTKKGGWKGRVGDQVGAIIVGGAVPESWKAGATVEVQVVSDEPQFRWPPKDPPRQGRGAPRRPRGRR